MDRLSSNARQSVTTLLESGETLETVSTWADQVKMQRRPDTMNWHYVLIPLKYSNYNRARDCGKRDCIIEAIEKQLLVLKNSKLPRETRAEALKFLVHLIGDLHVPFHIATNDNPPDSGAARVKVTFLNGRPTNLHAVWDDDIINYALRQSRQGVAGYASQLSSKAGRGSISTQGSVTEWALEAHRLANDAYKPSPNYFMIKDGKVWNLDETYYQKNKPVVDNQLVRAGVRLAAILNEIFGGQAR
jgi:hypothetical protein